MLALKPNPWGINDLTMKNELRYMILDFQENTEGKFVAGFRKPRNFTDDYCQVNYSIGPSSMNIVGIQDKRTHEWLYTSEAKEFFNVQMEQFDDAVLVYVEKKPKGYWEFWYRFDTEQELWEGEDDVGY